jgi:hypothetical protein
MAHISEPRVAETTTTTGTGNITLAGAVVGFRTFASVAATNDTALYYIEAVDSGGIPTGDWEFGLGTYSGVNTLTRTTVIRSSNAGAAVSFSAGTKRVVIALPAEAILSAAPSTNQNDYNTGSLANLINCRELQLGITATIKLTGLSATYDGHEVTIVNTSTDFMLWLENQNTASTAANRFSLPNGFPYFLLPGDNITLKYSTVSSRWRAVAASSNLSLMGLSEFTDFAGGVVGQFTSTVSGTGASSQQSAYLINTTERPMGVTQIDTGTTATGRATIGYAGTDGIIPTLGAALSVARLAQEAANSGTETYQLISGFADSSGGTFTDGVAWNLRWNGAAQEWSQDRLSNSTATRSVTGSPTPDNNYIWVAVFVNPGWTRADFIFSTDSVSFTKADSPTTGLPGSTRPTAWVAASMIKSVGTTQRNCSIDLAGYRVDYVRG